MKLRIGDKVRFLNEKGEGIIVRLKDKDNAYVEIEGGFEIPYPLNQLVPIHTELVLNAEAENLDLEPEKNIEERVFFVVEPDHELPLLVSHYSFYIYNCSSYNLHFAYSLKDGNLFQTIKHGEVGQFQKLLLKKINKGHLKEYAFHKLDILYYKNSHHGAQVPTAEIVHLNEQVITKHNLIKHHEFKFPILAFPVKENFLRPNELRYNLTEYDIERLKLMKEFRPDAKQSKAAASMIPHLEKEVDLHIEELVDSHKGWGNAQIIQFQLRHFQKELDNAISNNFHKIIFIHGVGNGRLKQELIAILKNYPELAYQDASYKKYGFGATEVILRR
jgi:hypothetical protein